MAGGVEDRRQLPPKTRKILLEIAERLRGGFTGRIEVDCNQGGITGAWARERITPGDAPKNRRP